MRWLAPLALVAGSAFGQFASMNGMPWSQEGDVLKVTIEGPVTAFPAVTGAPYYAERTSQNVRTLADGARVTRTSTSEQTMWRDSAGRQRVEQTLAGSELNAKFVLVEISDPVAGFAYVIDRKAEVAHRFAIGPAKQWAPSGSGLKPVTPLSESLGEKSIQGVVAQGTRFTTVIPVGQAGNDRQIVTTAESWYSPDLQLMLLSSSNDPRYGDDVVRLNNISRAEPDAALFAPPAGYAVVDAQSSVTLLLPKL